MQARALAKRLQAKSAQSLRAVLCTVVFNLFGVRAHVARNYNFRTRLRKSLTQKVRNLLVEQIIRFCLMPSVPKYCIQINICSATCIGMRKIAKTVCFDGNAVKSYEKRAEKAARSHRQFAFKQAFYYIVGGDCTVGACGYDLAKSFSLTSPTA